MLTEAGGRKLTRVPGLTADTFPSPVMDLDKRYAESWGWVGSSVSQGQIPKAISFGA